MSELKSSRYHSKQNLLDAKKVLMRSNTLVLYGVIVNSHDHVRCEMDLDR